MVIIILISLTVFCCLYNLGLCLFDAVGSAFLRQVIHWKCEAADVGMSQSRNRAAPMKAATKHLAKPSVFFLMGNKYRLHCLYGTLSA